MNDYVGSPAVLPDVVGEVERDGVRIHYETYGDGEPTLLLLPTWSIVHSRVWRNQLAYFARRYRVVLFDGRGNGRSDRPVEPAAYQPMDFALDALAVLDVTRTERAITVSLSAGTAWNVILAALHPERVAAAAFVAPTVYAVCEPFPEWSTTPYNERFDSYDGFPGQNRYFIGEHYREFVEFWTRMCFPERHSTRAIEYGIGMALETTPETILATLDASGMREMHCPADRLASAGAQLQQLAVQVQCPVLVVQGALEKIVMREWAEALARDTGGELVIFPDAGHVPGGRKPVAFNLLLRRFVDRVHAEVTAPSRALHG
jgi:pimeloyl-ACP methyl ester carboxylesterase